MYSIKRILNFTVFLLSLIFVFSPANTLVCPEYEEIFPCTCSLGYDGIACTGSDITQAHIENLISFLRTTNNMTGVDDWLSLESHWIYIHSTTLTQLDLRPFLQSRFKALSVENNPSLSEIFVSPASCSKFPVAVELIDTPDIFFGGNALTDAGLQSTFLYFIPTSVKTVWLGTNQLEGTVNSDGFLPGFTSFTNLVGLYLSNNQISGIGGGQFQVHNQLIMLDLTHNGMEEIGEDGLFLDSVGVRPPAYRHLLLERNKLTDEGIHSNNGLNSWRGQVVLSLINNNLTTFGQDKFESFLYGHVDTSVSLFWNPLFCDKNMKWMRDQKEQLEHRIMEAVCENDYPNTIFQTELPLT